MKLIETVLRRQRSAHSELRTQLSDQRRLPFDHPTGKPILGNSIPEHSPGVVQSIEDGYGVARHGQVMGTGQSCGAAANDSHLLALGPLRCRPTGGPSGQDGEMPPPLAAGVTESGVSRFLRKSIVESRLEPLGLIESVNEGTIPIHWAKEGLHPFGGPWRTACPCPTFLPPSFRLSGRTV